MKKYIIAAIFMNLPVAQAVEVKVEYSPTELARVADKFTHQHRKGEGCLEHILTTKEHAFAIASGLKISSISFNAEIGSLSGDFKVIYTDPNGKTSYQTIEPCTQKY